MDSYNQKIRSALLAVQQMHTDTSKFLQHCDRAICSGKTPVFGNYATSSLSWHVDNKNWMADGVYRYWDWSDELPGLVDGVTVDFGIADNGGTLPTLICGRLQYQVDGEIDKKSDSLKGICSGWDLWHRFYELEESQRPFNKTLTVPNNGLILTGTMLAIPLYDLTKRDQIVELMRDVRANFKAVQLVEDIK